MFAKKKRLTVYTNMWLGYEYITAVKPLGVDCASGLQVQYASARRRLAKATEVARNLKAMAVPGVSYINVIRAQAMGSTRYGVATIGMPKVILDGVRRIIRATTSTKAKGGSATADLALQKAVDLDPAYTASAVPIAKWTRQIYVRSDKRHKMKVAWEKGGGAQ